ncbi:MAG: hypothetical protein AB4063_16985 [Crocosphaera sp.]
MKRIRHKQCNLCHTVSNTLYRVQIDSSQQWQFICQHCWHQVHHDNPYYVYGGTWKSKKRR